MKPALKRILEVAGATACLTCLALALVYAIVDLTTHRTTHREVWALCLEDPADEYSLADCDEYYNKYKTKMNWPIDLEE